MIRKFVLSRTRLSRYTSTTVAHPWFNIDWHQLIKGQFHFLMVMTVRRNNSCPSLLRCVGMVCSWTGKGVALLNDRSWEEGLRNKTIIISCEVKVFMGKGECLSKIKLRVHIQEGEKGEEGEEEEEEEEEAGRENEMHTQKVELVRHLYQPLSPIYGELVLAGLLL